MTNHKVYIGDARNMAQVADESIHLIVTSPPYWSIKNYDDLDQQIGFAESYDDYRLSLGKVWIECKRVLVPGGKLVINIGNQYMRAKTYGRFCIMPIHADITSQCTHLLDLDLFDEIIWQKFSTCNTSGGGKIMGSYPFPTNGHVRKDFEFILIFKKFCKKERPRPGPELLEKSKLTLEEWREYFQGHWQIKGERQNKNHPATFPLELPRRIIKMYSFYGDTVLDPFIGSGTTALACKETGRNSIGYELNPNYINVMKAKVGDDIQIEGEQT